MISPEMLRKFPFFHGYTDQQLKALAMIADEASGKKGAILFEEGQPADKFYLLIDGNIDLFVKSEEENDPKSRRDFTVGEINPGEVFGMSVLWEPYKFGYTARAALDCKFIEFEGSALRELIQTDKDFGYLFIDHTAKKLMERLAYARVQLAAAWAR